MAARAAESPMRELAALLARNLPAAVMLSAVGVVFPPGILLSAATVALVTLSGGQTRGLIVLAGATGVGGALGAVLGMDPGHAALLLLAGCTPAWILSDLLRRSGSLPVTVLVACGLAIVGVLVFYAIVPVPAEWWHTWFAETWDKIAAASDAVVDTATRNDWLGLLRYEILTGGAASNGMFFALGAVFAGRSLQALLVNPGGFREEFHNLRLGRTAAMVSIAVLALGLFAGSELLANVSAVVWSLWVLKGIALAHGVVAAASLPSGWLVMMYVGLVIFSGPAMALVSVVGLADEFADFRGRLARRQSASPTDE